VERVVLNALVPADAGRLCRLIERSAFWTDYWPSATYIVFRRSRSTLEA